MRLHEVLKLPVFKNAKLKTKNIGLNNKVESIMILEAPDIEYWGKKNQLILTSYFALKDMDNSELIKFIKKLHQLKITGIILKVDRLVEEAPSNFNRLCIEYKIPLIEIPRNINYENIIISIFEPILNYESFLLRTYYETNRIFSNIPADKISYKILLDLTKNILRKPCRLKIPEHGINITSGEFQEFGCKIQKSVEYKTLYTKNIYKLIIYNNQKSVVKVLNPSKNLLDFSLEIQQDNPEISESEIMIIENVIEFIYREIYKEYFVKKERYILLNNIAASILYNSTNYDDIDNLLEEVGLNKGEYYQAIAIPKNEKFSAIENRILIKKLEKLGLSNIYYENRKYVIIIYNLISTNKKITEQYLENFFTNNLNCQLFITEIKKKDSIHEILKECEAMYKFNKKYYMKNILDINDLGFFRSITEIDTIHEESFIPPSLLDLYNNEPSLFNTFFLFIKNNQNYKKTADELFLHPKSIRYRMGKISEILNFNIDNPIELLNYSIGSYLLVFKNERKKRK